MIVQIIWTAVLVFLVSLLLWLFQPSSWDKK